QLIKKFIALRENAGGSKRQMISIAKKIFGWGHMEFHLNYFRPEVQLFFICNTKKVAKVPRVHKNISEKLIRYQEICNQENQTFFAKDFYERFGLSKGIVRYYNLF